MRVLLVALCFCAFVSGAKASYLISPLGEAEQQPMHRAYRAYGRVMHQVRPARQIMRHASYASMDSQVVSHPEGCPRSQFCGCGVSVRVFGHPVRELFLVHNWYRYPRAAAAAGNVAILGSQHVAYIIQAYGDGTATLYDPNSGGGLTRIRRVSLRGWAVVDPHASVHANVRRRWQYAGA
jgi:hypothetical protein